MQNFEFDRGISLKISAESSAQFLGQTFAGTHPSLAQSGRMSKAASRAELEGDLSYHSQDAGTGHSRADNLASNPFKATLDLDPLPKMSNLQMMASQNVDQDAASNSPWNKTGKSSSRPGLITESVPKATMISQISNLQVSALEPKQPSEMRDSSQTANVLGESSGTVEVDKEQRRRDMQYGTFGGRAAETAVVGHDSQLRVVSGVASSLPKHSDVVVGASGRRYAANVDGDEASQRNSDFSRQYQYEYRRNQGSTSDWNQSANKDDRKEHRKALLAGEDASQTVIAESQVTSSHAARRDYDRHSDARKYQQSSALGIQQPPDEIEGLSHAESRNFSVSTPYSVKDKSSVSHSKAGQPASSYNHEPFRASRIIEPALGRYSQLGAKESAYPLSGNISSATNALFVSSKLTSGFPRNGRGLL